jgi:hypothetical protein
VKTSSLIRLSSRTRKPRRTLLRFLASFVVFSRKRMCLGGNWYQTGLCHGVVLFVVATPLPIHTHIPAPPQPGKWLMMALSLIESKAFRSGASRRRRRRRGGHPWISPLLSDLFRYFICVGSLSPPFSPSLLYNAVYDILSEDEFVRRIDPLFPIFLLFFFLYFY